MIKEIDWYKKEVGPNYTGKNGRKLVIPFDTEINGVKVSCLVPAELYFCKGDPGFRKNKRDYFIYDGENPEEILKQRLGGDRSKTLKFMSLFNCQVDDADIEAEINKYREEFDKEYDGNMDTNIYGIECVLAETIGEDCHYW